MKDESGAKLESVPASDWILNSYDIHARELRRDAQRARGRFKYGSGLYVLYHAEIERYADALDAAATLIEAWRKKEPK